MYLVLYAVVLQDLRKSMKLIHYAHFRTTVNSVFLLTEENLQNKFNLPKT